mmetsp:Transcript_63693/g.136906  ORF Transcript_63693/g.136906 Transcript_63693/m.136906 type:complete len:253 (-) Transcript_63693:1938-2696(-)
MASEMGDPRIFSKSSDDTKARLQTSFSCICNSWSRFALCRFRHCTTRRSTPRYSRVNRARKRSLSLTSVPNCNSWSRAATRNAKSPARCTDVLKRGADRTHSVGKMYRPMFASRIRRICRAAPSLLASSALTSAITLPASALSSWSLVAKTSATSDSRTAVSSLCWGEFSPSSAAQPHAAPVAANLPSCARSPQLPLAERCHNCSSLNAGGARAQAAWKSQRKPLPSSEPHCRNCCRIGAPLGSCLWMLRNG